MIKQLATVTVLAASVLAAAPVAQAAAPAARPGPSAGVPGAPLLDGLLGILEVGHPAASAQSLVPGGVLGR
ncbi:hypothetical protein ACGFZL_01210 [Streptomyces sp. NPDC048182]|uniref:hypothetical protein n=1 Tax=Streptomyces sp. NPDC048182 TaxID=3365507 RepID=UPI00372454B1